MYTIILCNCISLEALNFPLMKSLYNYMTPNNFRSSKAFGILLNGAQYSQITSDFKFIEVFSEAVSDYISYLTINGIDIDFQNDELLKQCNKKELVKTLLLQNSDLTAIFKDCTFFNARKDIIYDYTKSLLETEDSIDIWNTSEISDVCQILYGGINGSPRPGISNPEELKKMIDKKFSITETSKKESKEKVDSFIDKYQNIPIKSESEFDEFLKYLQTYKISNLFTLEQDKIDFIIKQVLSRESILTQNPDKYCSFMERLLEIFQKTYLVLLYFRVMS